MPVMHEKFLHTCNLSASQSLCYTTVGIFSVNPEQLTAKSIQGLLINCVCTAGVELNADMTESLLHFLNS